MFAGRFKGFQVCQAIPDKPSDFDVGQGVAFGAAPGRKRCRGHAKPICHVLRRQEVRFLDCSRHVVGSFEHVSSMLKGSQLGSYLSIKADRGFGALSGPGIGDIST